MMPSGHKAFIVHNVKDVELLLMHNKTFAAEYVPFSLALAGRNRERLPVNVGVSEAAVSERVAMLTVLPGSPMPSRHESGLTSSPGRSSWASRSPTRRRRSRPRCKRVQNVGIVETAFFCCPTVFGASFRLSGQARSTSLPLSLRGSPRADKDKSSFCTAGESMRCKHVRRRHEETQHAYLCKSPAM